MKTIIAGALVSTLVATQAQAADPTLLEQGKAAFIDHCAACHGTQVVSGKQHLPGTEALAVKYEGKVPGALEERTDLSSQLIKTFVRTGVSVMPFFRKTMVTDVELEAIAAYLSRNYHPAGTTGSQAENP
jgi:(+)-pinoresinol hydroxylase